MLPTIGYSIVHFAALFSLAALCCGNYNTTISTIGAIELGQYKSNGTLGTSVCYIGETGHALWKHVVAIGAPSSSAWAIGSVFLLELADSSLSIVRNTTIQPGLGIFPESAVTPAAGFGQSVAYLREDPRDHRRIMVAVGAPEYNSIGK